MSIYLSIHTCISIYRHTHTHTHTHIYNVCACVHTYHIIYLHTHAHNAQERATLASDLVVFAEDHPAPSRSAPRQVVTRLYLYVHTCIHISALTHHHEHSGSKHAKSAYTRLECTYALTPTTSTAGAGTSDSAGLRPGRACRMYTYTPAYAYMCM